MTPDKVHISAYYDEAGCHSVEIVLNYDGISAADLTEAIRAAFNPYPSLSETLRNRELGETDVIHMPNRNGGTGGSTKLSLNIPRSV